MKVSGNPVILRVWFPGSASSVKRAVRLHRPLEGGQHSISNAGDDAGSGVLEGNMPVHTVEFAGVILGGQKNNKYGDA